MIEQVELTTERLVLRPFDGTDANDVRRLAGHPDVAKTTLHIPHPYPKVAAEDWIAGHGRQLSAGTCVTYAIVDRGTGTLVGAISATVSRPNARAEMGYWIGKPFWGKGFCTEAAKALLAFCFDNLKLNRVHAHHFAENRASGRVMEKAGMVYEGTLRAHVVKDGKAKDLVAYGVLREAWERWKRVQKDA